MKTQARIYEFIKSFIDKNGYAPTIREITNAVYLCSTSTTSGHLDRLKRKGMIDWKKGSPRSISIPERKELEIQVLEWEDGEPSVIAWHGRRFLAEIQIP